MKSRQTDVPASVIKKIPFLFSVYQWSLVPVRDCSISIIWNVQEKLCLWPGRSKPIFFKPWSRGLVSSMQLCQYSILNQAVLTALCSLSAYKMVTLLISYIKPFWELPVKGEIEKQPRIAPRQLQKAQCCCWHGFHMIKSWFARVCATSILHDSKLVRFCFLGVPCQSRVPREHQEMHYHLC